MKKLLISIKVLILGIFTAITVYPLFWLVTVSLKKHSEFLTSPFSLPVNPQWINYLTALGNSNIQRYFLNSIIVTSVALLFILILGVPAGYGIARMRVRFRENIMMLFLLSNLVPVTIIIIPLFFWINTLSIHMDLIALIIVYIANSISFTIFLSRGFFRRIPIALNEAATIDGCSEYQTFFYVMLPQIKAGLMVIIIITFINLWNEYFIAMIIIQNDTLRTLPIGLVEFKRLFSTNWPLITAVLTVATIPTIILYSFCKKYIVEGIKSNIQK